MASPTRHPRKPQRLMVRLELIMEPCPCQLGESLGGLALNGFFSLAESVKEDTHQQSRKGAAAVTCGSGPRRGHHARKAHSQKNSVTTGAPKVMLHKPSLPRTSTSQPTFSTTRPPRWPSTIPTLPELSAEPAKRGSSLFQKTTVLRPHLQGQ